jgi:hypothetical protein
LALSEVENTNPLRSDCEAVPFSLANNFVPLETVVDYKENVTKLAAVCKSPRGVTPQSTDMRGEKGLT